MAESTCFKSAVVPVVLILAFDSGLGPVLAPMVVAGFSAQRLSQKIYTDSPAGHLDIWIVMS